MQPFEVAVESSNLARIRWNGFDTLDVLFKSGLGYRYQPCPEEKADGITRAVSKGEYFAAEIRNVIHCVKLPSWDDKGITVTEERPVNWRTGEREERPAPVGPKRITPDNVHAINAYQSLDGDQQARIHPLREVFEQAMRAVLINCPETPLRTRCLNALDDARMQAICCIAREKLSGD